MTQDTFQSVFRVRAGIESVAAFHRDARALKRLTPPPILVQFHQLEPLSEGAMVDFTMWFAFIPVHWKARHKNFHPLHGFTDVQVAGPLAKWEHTHSFEAVDDCTSLVRDSLVYQHHPGWRGGLTRLVFNRVGLSLLFAYRKLATRWLLRQSRKTCGSTAG